jgi:hypothetical protein
VKNCNAGDICVCQVSTQPVSATMTGWGVNVSCRVSTALPRQTSPVSATTATLARAATTCVGTMALAITAPVTASLDGGVSCCDVCVA